MQDTESVGVVERGVEGLAVAAHIAGVAAVESPSRPAGVGPVITRAVRSHAGALPGSLGQLARLWVSVQHRHRSGTAEAPCVDEALVLRELQALDIVEAPAVDAGVRSSLRRAVVGDAEMLARERDQPALGVALEGCDGGLAGRGRVEELVVGGQHVPRVLDLDALATGGSGTRLSRAVARDAAVLALQLVDPPGAGASL